MAQLKNNVSSDKNKAESKASNVEASVANTKVTNIADVASVTKSAKKVEAKKKASPKKIKAKKAAPKKAKKVAAKAKKTSAKSSAKVAPKSTSSQQKKSAIFGDASMAGEEVVKQIFEAGNETLNKMYDKVSIFGEEGSKHASRSAEACAEYKNNIAEVGQEICEEMFDFANEYVSSNMEMSQEFFSCRTLSDLFDLNNQIATSNMDMIYAESAKISERIFDIANDSSEPLAKQFENAVDNLTKKFSC